MEREKIMYAILDIYTDLMPSTAVRSSLQAIK